MNFPKFRLWLEFEDFKIFEFERREYVKEKINVRGLEFFQTLSLTV